MPDVILKDVPSTRHPPEEILAAFDYCESIARRHYENFPVASLMLPRTLRPHIAAIYAFARTADDFADEGNHTTDERLRALDDWQHQLEECCDGNATNPIFVALAEVVSEKHIPKQLLLDLLHAFKMDVTINRYQTFPDLLSYCKHSANPVGRLVLHLFGLATPQTLFLSDNICTALQLANFWQDINVDRQKNRMYLPLEDIERFGYTEEELLSGKSNGKFDSLLQFELGRTRDFFIAGKPLLKEVSGRLRIELALTWNGGMTILKKVGQTGSRILAERPALTTFDKLSILTRSLLPTI